MPKKKNTTTSHRPRQKQGIVGRLMEARRNRIAQKRRERHDKLIAFTQRHQIHGLPLALDGAMLSTGIATALDPMAGLIVGASTSTIAGAGAGFQLESNRELVLVGGHLAAGMGWAAASGIVGLGSPVILTAGLAIAGFFQLTWLDQRNTRSAKTAASKSVAELWNTEETGLLAQVGAEGARMVEHRTVHNQDGAEIGDDYVVDTRHASLSQADFTGKGQALAEKMPGKVRRGAINVYKDNEDSNRSTVRAIWTAPWSNKDPRTVATHPLVLHAQQMASIIDGAVDRRLHNPDRPPQAIPRGLWPWFPGTRSYADPIAVGEREDRSTYWERNYEKGFGVIHKFVIAETGGGKTSYINSQIASSLACDDVLIWVVDVSMKQGSHFAGWGSCIDWIATDRDQALAMFQSAINIAKERGDAYRGTGPARSPRQCPTIKIIVDELSALYDALEDDVLEYVDPLARQGRTQGVQLELYDQTGVQINKPGLKDIMRNLTKRASLKVRDEGNLKNALSNPDEVPYDMSSAPRGVVALETPDADRAEVFRSYLVPEGDEEDPDDHGMLAPIASLYAPFRPVLDEESYRAAGKAYHERPLVRTENPLLTPEEFAMSHAPVNPVYTEADLDENVSNIRTGSDWLDKLMNGELTMRTADIDLDNDQITESASESSPSDSPAKSMTTIAKDQGIPTSAAPSARQQRRQLTRQRHDEKSVELDVALADMAVKQEQIPSGMTVADAIGEQPEPTAYPDDDSIMVAAIELLRTQASKGTTTRDIAARAGVKKMDTVGYRLKYLKHTGRAVRTGSGKSARWYHPDSAPAAE